MNSSLFISGTGTDVGKTFLSAFLLGAAQNLGLKTCYWKPIQCGSADWNGLHFSEGDSGVVHHLISNTFMVQNTPLNKEQPISIIPGIFLNSPCSPHYAFERENLIFDLRQLESKYQEIQSQNFDLILIEGAGGLEVPIDLQSDFTMSSLAKHFNWDIILAASPLLGTINHSLLTIKSIHQNLPGKLSLVAFTYDPKMEHDNLSMVENNKETIISLSPEILNVIPQIPAWENWNQWDSKDWENYWIRYPEFQAILKGSVSTVDV